MSSNCKKRRKKDMPLLLNKDVDNPRVESRLLNKLNRLTKDYSWIADNKEELVKSHLNLYIAVKNQKIAFEDKDFDGLLTKIRRSRHKVDEYAIDFVRRHPVCLLL